MSRKGAGATVRNQFRIIAGRWRGQKLTFADVAAIRPTPDRVRETLFNWLQADIAGARCLDLFTGSGALGFEALSRGAGFVQFVDLERAVCQQIQQNLKKLGNSDCAVSQRSAQDFLSGSVEPFDIVFLDPPFNQDMVYPVCEQLERDGWLNSYALVYIESEMAIDECLLPDEKWQIHRRKQAGQVHYTLITRNPE